MTGRAVAVMQPYFFPYAGYFRLFAACDLFIIYDCVQFPRRGRVHRCEVPSAAGSAAWLTLPLARQQREVLIRDLEFAADARAEFDRRLARLGWIARGKGPSAEAIRQFLHAPLGSTIDYLEAGLRLVASALGLETEIVRSSAYGIGRELSGERRIIAIAKAAGASRYINTPGGKVLYDSAAFGAASLELCFLAPYQGRFRHLLFDLMQVNPATIAADVRDQTVLEAG
jgi:hypothetical protein